MPLKALKMRTDKQERFIESYCLTGNAAKAAEMAGYSKKGSKQMGYMLKNQFSSEIDERMRKMIQDAVPGALAQVNDLVANAVSEGVRLNACRDVLDRAGFKPVERQEISHVETSSIEELEQELKALLN
jgi:phage terminase small subunit|tara:strand:- start:13 stop:399 length:387 start_codon:yes stop_codon:yes gene_type:complete